MGLYSLATGGELDRFMNPDKEAPMSRGMLSPDGTKLVTIPLTGWPLILDLSNTKRQARLFRAESDTLSAGLHWAWSPQSGIRRISTLRPPSPILERQDT